MKLPSFIPAFPVPTAEHEPVLLAETLSYLTESKTLIDATVGLGGHSEALLTANPDARILGLDRDAGALALAQKRLNRFGKRLTLVHGSFADLPDIAPRAFRRPDGILMDLGISSWQLSSRGFSFRSDELLDLRMDVTNGETAAELIKRLPEADLADVLYQYGEEYRSRRIAKAVKANPVDTASELAAVIQGAVGRRGRLHPATKSFQALRIAVNDELGALERGLAAAEQMLTSGGSLVVISFHSLEDRIVKRFIKGSTLTPLNKKVVRPAREEVVRNSRSRSAKLRAAVRDS